MGCAAYTEIEPLPVTHAETASANRVLSESRETDTCRLRLKEWRRVAARDESLLTSADIIVALEPSQHTVEGRSAGKRATCARTLTGAQVRAWTENLMPHRSTAYGTRAGSNENAMLRLVECR